MKGPTQYVTSQRRSEDKTSWKDQLSPRIKGRFKSLRHSEAKTPQKEEDDFRIVHFPDRPVRRITAAEIPSEEECRAFLIGLRRRSVDSPAAKSMSEDNAADKPEEEAKGWDTDSKATRMGFRLQTPEDGRSEVPEDGIIMTARTYSPHPYIGEAKEVKLEKLVTKQLTPSNLSPRQAPTTRNTPTPAHPEEVVNEQWRWRMSPAQLVRRPSKSEEGLRSHSIHVHVRTNSTSDPLCRVCHNGLAEVSGVCQTCSEEYTTPDDISPHRPPALSRPKASIPHTLDKIACQHRVTPSLTSNPEANITSPPESPYGTVHTVVTMDSPPLTPLSALPTPHLLARLEGHTDDVYEDEWADYYFNDDNFKCDETGGGEEVEADGFVLKELSLEEYDRAFASPISPRLGWI